MQSSSYSTNSSAAVVVNNLCGFHGGNNMADVNISIRIKDL